MHDPEIIECDNRRGQLRKKSNIVVQYNSGMSGIDRSDQMMSCYPALRKTIRWYKKIGIHFIEMFIANDQIFYYDSANPKMKMLDFICRHLTGIKEHGRRQEELRQEQSEELGRQLENQVSRHYPKAIPSTEKKNNPTRKCVQCRIIGIRRESRYYCPLCSNTPT